MATSEPRHGAEMVVPKEHADLARLHLRMERELR